jgi:hypothetical protein
MSIINLTIEEAQSIQDFIFSSLYRDWDNYTNNYICPGTTVSEGMRRMDPEMYEMISILGTRISKSESP